MLSLPRDRQPEIMDSPQLDEERRREALAALDRINRVSRSAANLWREIRRQLGAPSAAALRVLDVCCGGGDVAVTLERIMRRAGVNVCMLGCDKSPVAVARARERAAAAGSGATFFRADLFEDELPDDIDLVCNSLFLHHLDDADAVEALRRLSGASRRLMVVQDLVRSRTGYALARLGVALLTRSEVARFDGPVSVRGAFTPDEARSLAARAGLEVGIRRAWPQRYCMVWSRP